MSPRRDFRGGVAYAIIVRFSLQLPLLEFPELEDLLGMLLARFEPHCAVDAVAYQFRPNHIHLTLVQEDDGCDPDGIVGIAAFMRNVLSQFVLLAKRQYPLVGLRTAEVYVSHDKESGEAVLTNMAYTDANNLHHINQAPSQARTSSYRMHASGKPDGLVTLVPELLAQLGMSWARYVLLVARKAKTLEALGVKNHWRAATCAVVQRHCPSLVKTLALPARMRRITEVADPALHQLRRTERIARGRRAIASLALRSAPMLARRFDGLSRQFGDSSQPS